MEETLTPIVVYESFWNANKTFWENFEVGPRTLTLQETQKIQKFKDEIEKLKGENGLDLSMDFFGHRIDSPVGLCAGPAPNSKFLSLYSELGYDILTWKTVRDKFLKGHPLPNILYVQGDFESGFTVTKQFNGTITNSFGIGSKDPEEWTQDVIQFLKMVPKGQTLKVSVIPHEEKLINREDTISSFAKLAKIVQDTGCHGVEFDIACPNFCGKGGDIYQDVIFTREIVEAARDEIGSHYPLFLKIGHIKDYKPLIEETKGLVDAFVAINAMPARVNYPDGTPVFPDRGNKSGISGKALFAMGIDAVKQLVKLRENPNDYMIIGVGGIISSKEAMEYLEVGADCIEIGAGVIYNPFLALEIKRDLLKSKQS